MLYVVCCQEEKIESIIGYCYIGKCDGSKIEFQKDEIEQVKFANKEEFKELFKEDNDPAVDLEIEWVLKMWR